MIIQGPNLNMLGHRETNLYGTASLEQIHQALEHSAKQHEIKLEFFQSNLEGEIVDKIQECLGEVNGIVINPAAFGHTSIAIRDALSAVSLPTIEVHLTNIYAREQFRQSSMISAVCAGTITGLGPFGYQLALMALMQINQEIAAANKSQKQD